MNAWHDIFSHPNDLEFADAYLATLALSHPLRRYYDDDLGLETEGQVVYNFGDQSHWEFNALLAARWYRFPWNDQRGDDRGVRRWTFVGKRSSGGRRRTRGFQRTVADLLALEMTVRAARLTLGHDFAISPPSVRRLRAAGRRRRHESTVCRGKGPVLNAAVTRQFERLDRCARLANRMEAEASTCASNVAGCPEAAARRQAGLAIWRQDNAQVRLNLMKTGPWPVLASTARTIATPGSSPLAYE